MPMAWIEPEVAFNHRGATIYHTYRNDDADERREYWFSTSSCENGEYEFDVRDLPVPAGVDHGDFERIIAHAIDNGLIKFEEEPELEPVKVEMQVCTESLDGVTVDAAAMLKEMGSTELIRLAKDNWGRVELAGDVVGLLSDYKVAGFLAEIPENKVVFMKINAEQALEFTKSCRVADYWEIQCALGRAVKVKGTVDEDLTVSKEVVAYIGLSEEQQSRFVELDDAGEPQIDHLGLALDNEFSQLMSETVRAAAYERTITNPEHDWEPVETQDVRVNAELAEPAVVVVAG